MLRMLGGLLAVGLGLYFVWIAVPALSEANGALLRDASVWGSLALAAFCYSLIIPISAWAWSGLLAHYGQSPGWRHALHRDGRTQLAKYVPGNVAQHGLRLALALRAGVRGDAFSGTVVQETFSRCRPVSRRRDRIDDRGTESGDSSAGPRSTLPDSRLPPALPWC